MKTISRWIILDCDDQIGAMYRSLYNLEYFYKPKIQRPIWGTHISVIRGEAILNEDKKEKWNNQSIDYLYISEIMTNGVHFWLPVKCEALDVIRNDFGLGPKIVDYHLSIGNICDGSGQTEPEEFR